MPKKLFSQTIIIKDCTEANIHFWKLYRIFRLTICPGMPYKIFEAYYKSKNLDYINATFFYDSKNELAGFCTAAFYKTIIANKPVTIARSATGFLKNHQGKALSKWKLYSKFMQYKLNNPFRRLILTIYAGNPLIYNMICKYTGIVYPKVGKRVPEKIIVIKNEILHAGKLQHREAEPFVVKINFEVQKSEEFKQRAKTSNNIHVQFFIEKTGMKYCNTLLLIIPITFLNILLSIWLIIKYSQLQIVCFFIKFLMARFKKCKEWYILSFQFYSSRKRHYDSR